MYDIMSANVLFFSNGCDGSQALLSLMQSEGLIKFFHLICTDNNNKIPSQITVTPTLIIRGVPIPYVAAGAFAWFSKVKQWKINTMMQRMADAQKQHMQSDSSANGNSDNSESNLLGFSKAEMEGMSDMFAYLGADETAAPHSQLSYNNIEKDHIIGKSHGHEEDKLDEIQQKQRYHKMESDRKKQEQMFKQQIDSFKNQQYK